MKSIVIFLLLTFSSTVSGRVFIIKPYHPFYVFAGNNVTLTCKSNQYRILQWLQQTPLNKWTDTLVNATAGSGFVIRTLTEQPSGYVESTLIKTNIQLLERGLYTCRDADAINSYSAWIIVLKILTEDVVHPYRAQSPENDSVMLYCNITGFDSNVPPILKQWSYKGNTINPEASEKYALVDKSGTSGLFISQPGHADIGTYECSFTLGTDTEPVTFKETLQLNVTGLPPEVSGSQTSEAVWSTVILLSALSYSLIYEVL